MKSERPHVLSIWHAGTRSTLEYYGLPQDHEHYTHLRAEFDGMHAFRAAALHRKVIMPMRDPRAIWVSWQKRSHVRYGRPNGGANNPKVFNYVFKLAHQIWQRHPIRLLPVDLPERELYLSEIEQALGLVPKVPKFPCVTDHLPVKPAPEDGIDWRTIYTLLNAMGLRYEYQAQ